MPVTILGFKIGALVVCSILVTSDKSSIPVIGKADITGKVIKAGQQKVLVNFSEGLTEYPLTTKENYKAVLVDKNECVDLGN